MTKLMEWVTVILIFLSTWLYLLFGKYSSDIPSYLYLHLLILPVYIVITFGIYALSVIVYRVYTFNDCIEAAESLRMEIIQANDDLRKRGFRFND